MFRSIILLIISLLTGCASKAYRDTPDGVFKGSLDVHWVENDLFVFTPHKDNPLTFIRSDGTKIQPGRMYTDGGSIPRFMWGIKGYSPWGYAPAYIVHDWLFEAQHCGYTPDNKYSFDDSVAIMAEGLKAVMEDETKFRNYFLFDTVVAAVGTPIAERLWDKGSCKPPADTLRALTEKKEPGTLIMTITY